MDRFNEIEDDVCWEAKNVDKEYGNHGFATRVLIAKDKESPAQVIRFVEVIGQPRKKVVKRTKSWSVTGKPSPKIQIIQTSNWVVSQAQLAEKPKIIQTY
ncbi:Uncharacterized protein TCM_028948 [Theobroma cacao]|uniref:Uncharacterized protein n=1 Tax=Theobroma cacao TaxID=3641 RepID=A0A061GIU8_THECC|nr:Uncharacterized protein TCM_028948 [Theobroma cacao]